METLSLHKICRFLLIYLEVIKIISDMKNKFISTINSRRGANNRAISEKSVGLHFGNRSVTVVAQYTGHAFINI